MRWIFISLVVINIAVFCYFQFSVERAEAAPSQSSLVPATDNSLLMLNERRRDTVLPPPVAAPVTHSGAGRESAALLCSLVGPFLRLLQAEYFVERLAALGVNASVKEVGIPIESGYWVYLAPEASRKEALRRLGELQNKGIDSYVIPKGELANGISLGMYTNKQRAVALQTSVNLQGYDASIADVPRQNKEVWVSLDAVEAAKIDENVWLELLGGEESIDKQQNFCSDLAS